MNEPTYRLNEQDVSKVYKWLVKHAPSDADWVRCPCCQKEDWTVSDGITKVESTPHGWFPSVLVICENCGFMMQLSAAAIGVCGFDEDESNG